VKTQDRTTSYRVGVVTLLLAFSTNGCTAIGAVVGGNIKTPRGDVRSGAPSEVAQLGKGNPVVLQLRDGRSVAGRFESLHTRVRSEYEPLYSAYLKTAEGTALPPLGPARLLVTGQTVPETVEFLGVEATGVAVQDHLGNRRIAGFYGLSSLSSGGQTVQAKTLESLVHSGSVPSLTEVRLKEPAARVGLNEVASIEFRPRKGHALIGAAFGLVLDVLLFWGLVEASKDY
jgi:hypothetical protein